MTSSDIIATCSVIVAVLAFFATAWQAWLSHRHNRLSVRPLLIWHTSRGNDPTRAGITYSVKNLGLGPAIVRDRYFTKNGERFTHPGMAIDEVKAFVEHVLGQQMQYHLHTFGLPGKDTAIPSQDEVVVADIKFPTLGANLLPTLQEMAGDIGFHINYKSMYGETFSLDIRLNRMG